MSRSHRARSRARASFVSDSDSDLDALSDTLFTDRRAARAHGAVCREVARTLGLAFASAADARLHDLVLVDVVPAPDVGRLAVHVVTAARDLDAIRAVLHGATGALRAELARVLQRRRTPQLVFVVAPAGGEEVAP